VSAVLVIAGVDSSGGAGLVRDVATLTRLGVPALCAVTAVTAQSDTAVSAIHAVPPALVRSQIEAAFATCPVTAVKIGMLVTRTTVLAVAEALAAHAAVPVVLDPVLLSSSGVTLLDAAGQAALMETLLARATLITPNIPELGMLLGCAAAGTDRELLQQGQALLARGAVAVLLKGGHASGAQASDLLLQRHAPLKRYTAARSAHGRRGTGCALATAIAAGLSRGADLQSACAAAKQHVMQLFSEPR
jgi:hydroxymethylpyrimidine/phosphomethylpyrimidine kinase